VNKTLISETVANCSTCKKWFHAVCEEATESDLNKKQWHCKLCYSNLSMNKKKRSN
jgi:predicted anti-sigma-YlaC factor YlaD